MHEIIEILNQGWIGTVIGVVGILIAIILACSFRPRSRLAAQTNTLEVVGPNAVLPKEIEFLFKGQKVPNVAMSRIAIWNIGNTTIKGDQIVTSDPLRIVTSDGSSILEATIRNRTRRVNDISCLLRQGMGNEVECRFDFLDPGDGALIQLIHTGSDTVKVLGTLRGVPKGVRMGSVPKQKPQAQRNLSPFAAKLIALIFLLAGLGLFVLIVTKRVSPEFPEDRPIAAMFAVVMIVLALLMFFSVQRYLPPSQLSTQMTSNEPRKAFWPRWTR